jgi:ribonuclease III
MGDMKTLANELADILGFQPIDMALYTRALTHGSTGEDDYQRLEFLGDRILGLVVAELLYRTHPDENEGRMAHRLNGLVNGTSCADVARDIALAPLVRLGKQARDDGARESDNVLGDVMEALIGALFLDHGFDTARTFVLRLWEPRLTSQQKAPKHPKSALQEWTAKVQKRPPDYAVTKKSGPPHAMRFEVTVTVKGLDPITGEGNSKQAAESDAAAKFLEQHT